MNTIRWTNGAVKKTWLKSPFVQDRLKRALDAVSAVTYVRPRDIMGKRRMAEVCTARFMVFRILRSEGLIYADIGTLMDRDHSTIIVGIKKLEADACVDFKIASGMIKAEALFNES
jgi:chromosomal replication initiation ATPase DnaA